MLDAVVAVLLRSIAIGAALLISSPTAAVTRDARPDSAIHERVEPLWHQDRLDELEAIVSELRTSRRTDPDGDDVLTQFYEAFSSQMLFGELVLGYPDSLTWRRIDAYEARFPDSPTPVLLRAAALINLANGVTDHQIIPHLQDSGWRPTHTYLSEAAEILRKSVVAAADPYHSVLRLRAEAFTGMSPENLILLHAELAANRPSFLALHVEAYLHLASLTASATSILSPLATAVRNSAPQGQADAVYARFLVSLAERRFGHEVLTLVPLRWELFAAGLKQIASDYPTETNRQRLALYSCLAGDLAVGVPAMKTMAVSPVRWVWRNPMTYKSCRKWAIE